MNLSRLGAAACLASLALISGCATRATIGEPAPTPAEVRARIVQLLPPKTRDRVGWATDIQAAFAALEIQPQDKNLCAAVAVTEQESTFEADPVVPNLASVARAEIDRRAASHHIPKFAVAAALRVKSPDGKRYDERIASIRSESQLSRIYEDLIGSVPLGRLLFADANPVRTGGPMQVSIAFAEQHAREHGYPYDVGESIRREVFTRRGGMYFGIAHLLGYPARYEQMLHHFADFNAGHYASRNAAFQQAVSLATGIPLALDGDLVLHGAGKEAGGIGTTERAVRSLGKRFDLSDARIRRELEQGAKEGFEETRLYRDVFDLAESIERRPLPRAIIPQIALHSPKITRKLTTEWFAKRVDERFRRCMARTSTGKTNPQPKPGSRKADRQRDAKS